MPELPEVETTRNGIMPYLLNQTINKIIIRENRFRLPVPEHLSRHCAKQKILAIKRRAKYLLLQLEQGHLLIHLGMSGHLRIVDATVPIQKHDHIDLILNNELILRFSDPRRFGIFTYLEEDPANHTLIKSLGPEPLTEAFNALYLAQKIQNRKKPIKAVIMDNHVVVGVGNIYATEGLFRAKIHPARPAHTLNKSELEALVYFINEVLQEAITQGGTTLKDFYGFDGKPGYFRLALQAYGRYQEPCFLCTTPLESLIIGGRSSVFCPECQKLN